MPQIKTAEVAELDPFELLPDAFVRIQLWGIGWQTLQMDAGRCSIREEFLDGMAAVDRRSIPENHHLARDFPQQMFQKGHDIVRVHRVVLRMEVEFALG